MADNAETEGKSECKITEVVKDTNGAKENEAEKVKENTKEQNEKEVSADSKEWFFLEGKERKGPVTWVEVCKKSDKQLIWKTGLQDWITLNAAKLMAQNDAWYYIDIGGAQQGPMKKWDLVNLAVTEQIKAETMIWKYGSATSWAPANTIEELRSSCGFSDPTKLPQESNADGPPPQAVVPDQELDWYYEDQYKEKQGPVNKPELLMMLEMEKIAEHTMVWKPGMEDWVTLHEALFGRRVEQSVPQKKEIKSEETKVEDIRHRLVKEVALTEECDPHSKVLGTVQKAMIVQILEAKNERLKIKAPNLTGWCKAEDEDGPLLERVKAKDLKKKRKRKKKRKWKDVQSNAIYVQGLPEDVTLKEIAEFFKKCGNIKRDILTGQLKIKLYQDKETKKLKGDGVVHFYQPESVALAVKLFDGDEIRPGVKVSVSMAEFKQKGEYKQQKKPKLTKAQRNVMRQVHKAYSTVSWEEDPDKMAPQLLIVVLKGMFTLEEVEEAPSPDYFYETLKMEVGMECERVGGPVEKITVFQGNPDGVIAVRFQKPSGSAACIDVMNNRWFAGRRVECIYWDGETDYRVKETEEEEQARLEAFSKELDAQKVPD